MISREALTRYNIAQVTLTTMRTLHHKREFLRIAARAMDGGATMEIEGDSPARLVWNTAKHCRAPVYTQLRTGKILRPPKAKISGGDFVKQISQVHTTEMLVACRRCDRCLKARSRLWTRRAKAEYEAASRTWFVTLTFKPEEHFAALCRARQRLLHNALDFDKLSESDQFGELHKECSRLVSLWLKRVRKNSGASFRYLMVVEPHKSGLPHYHLLIHEAEGGLIRHRVLANSWSAGFGLYKLVVDAKAAAYVCKYLSKTAAARVRASVGYGALAPMHSPQNMHHAL